MQKVHCNNEEIYDIIFLFASAGAGKVKSKSKGKGASVSVTLSKPSKKSARPFKYKEEGCDYAATKNSHSRRTCDRTQVSSLTFARRRFVSTRRRRADTSGSTCEYTQVSGLSNAIRRRVVTMRRREAMFSRSM